MAEKPKILHLTLKKKWFDMIASGEKKEEYRDWKRYWAIRLIEDGMRNVCAVYAGANNHWKHFDIVEFRNGYSRNAPTMQVQCKGIEFRNGRSEWGNGNKCLVIKLGKILSSTGKPV
jgi:hypothetical protein